jgi:hypothetical protein
VNRPSPTVPAAEVEVMVAGIPVVEGPAGTCYLLHFDRRFAHAGHYLGWAGPGRLAGRLAGHAAGRGARLLAVVADAGIGWTLARTWPGDRGRERALKRQGGASRRCPVCGVRPRPDRPPHARTAPTGRRGGSRGPAPARADPDPGGTR